MTAMHATDLAQTSANAMLTAKASKALSTVLGHHAITERQTAVLGRTAELFSRIVEGSLFVENRAATGLAASHVGLAEFERAISAARTLNLITEDRGLSDIFLEYRATLISVTSGQNVSADKVAEVQVFLSALSDFFYTDLVRPQSEDRTSRFALDN